LWDGVKTVVTGRPGRMARKITTENGSLDNVTAAVCLIVCGIGFTLIAIDMFLDLQGITLGVVGLAVSFFGMAVAASREIYVKRHRNAAAG
jgi:hypothetical protein